MNGRAVFEYVRGLAQVVEGVILAPVKIKRQINSGLGFYLIKTVSGRVLSIDSMQAEPPEEPVQDIQVEVLGERIGTFFMGIPDVGEHENWCDISARLDDGEALDHLLFFLREWRLRDLLLEDVLAFREHDCPEGA